MPPCHSGARAAANAVIPGLAQREPGIHLAPPVIARSVTTKQSRTTFVRTQPFSSHWIAASGWRPPRNDGGGRGRLSVWVPDGLTAFRNDTRRRSFRGMRPLSFRGMPSLSFRGSRSESPESILRHTLVIARRVTTTQSRTAADRAQPSSPHWIAASGWRPPRNDGGGAPWRGLHVLVMASRHSTIQAFPRVFPPATFPAQHPACEGANGRALCRYGADQKPRRA